MFTNTRMRRSALMFLFLALSLAGTVGPASAMLIPPYPAGNPDVSGSQTLGTHAEAAISSDTALLPWVLIGLTVAIVAAGAVMVALRRHGRVHRVALSS